MAKIMIRPAINLKTIGKNAQILIRPALELKKERIRPMSLI